MDCPIEVEYSRVLRHLNSSKLSDNVFFVLIEFIAAMQISKEDRSFRLHECNSPISVCPDGFCRLRAVTPISETDVKITDGLARLIVSAEGIVTGIDFVKVNEVSEEDISPQVVREDRASR